MFQWVCHGFEFIPSLGESPDQVRSSESSSPLLKGKGEFMTRGKKGGIILS